MHIPVQHLLVTARDLRITVGRIEQVLKNI
jgi:hypothetical protein